MKKFLKKEEPGEIENEMEWNEEIETQSDDFIHLDKDEEASAVEERSNESNDFRPLPPPLRMIQLQQVLLGIVLGIASIVLAVLTKEVKFLSLILLGLYFAGMAFLLEYDWRREKISEKVVACTHVITRTRTTQVICRDQNFIYTYFLPDKKSGFVEGYTYIIWTRNNNPKAVLAYQPL